MLGRRLLAFLLLVLGLLGVVACGAGGYGVWLVAAQLGQANERAFAAVDQGLVAARERIVGVQARVVDYKGTTDALAKLARGRAVTRWSFLAGPGWSPPYAPGPARGLRRVGQGACVWGGPRSKEVRRCDTDIG